MLAVGPCCSGNSRRKCRLCLCLFNFKFARAFLKWGRRPLGPGGDTEAGHRAHRMPGHTGTQGTGRGGGKCGDNKHKRMWTVEAMRFRKQVPANLLLLLPTKNLLIARFYFERILLELFIIGFHASQHIHTIMQCIAIVKCFLLALSS